MIMPWTIQMEADLSLASEDIWTSTLEVVDHGLVTMYLALQLLRNQIDFHVFFANLILESDCIFFYHRNLWLLKNSAKCSSEKNDSIYYEEILWSFDIKKKMDVIWMSL